MARERWWLEDYVLYRALHHEHQGRHWLEWNDGLRDRAPAALAGARERHASEILYRAWLQWVAHDQWQRARRDCGVIGIFGDFPFVVSADSADVWARQEEFRLDASVGTPPDAFSGAGQDWGLPVYRWETVAAGGYEWLRHRARRCTELYDAFRVDHLVGFYRTFTRERDGRTAFVPAEEPSQLAQGDRVLRLLDGGGAKIIAEDLGLVPDFVRESLARLQIPGFKVLRWEREWDLPGEPFRDPASYPQISVATTSTHDTETLAEWWDTADASERALAIELPPLAAAGYDAREPFSDQIRDVLLEALFCARSDLAIVPVQDVFGWRDRINIPALVDEINWTWRLPWPVDDLLSEPPAVDRAAFVGRLAARCGRDQTKGKS
jgi:4-alpha-glucanotransferase